MRVGEEEGWAGELALLCHYNGYRDDIREWDDDKLFWSLSQMQTAMRALKLRE